MKLKDSFLRFVTLGAHKNAHNLDGWPAWKGLAYILSFMAVWTVMLAFLVSPALHEGINYSIDRIYGLKAQIVYGPYYSNDCPWNCQQANFTSKWNTMVNGTQLALFEQTNPKAYSTFLSLVSFNEHDFGQMIPEVVIYALLILGFFISYAMQKR